jgi:gluconokinase
MAASSRNLGPLAIIIMGVSGCGKSTLADELSGVTGVSYLEGDAFHTPEAIAKMAAGSPLTDDDRWPWLDRLGQAIAADVGAHNFAIATCSALKRAYRDRLRQTIAVSVKFVQIEGDQDVLAHRLSERCGHYMPTSLLTSQLETLEPPDPDEHALILNATLPPPVLRDDVLKWIELA